MTYRWWHDFNTPFDATWTPYDVTSAESHIPAVGREVVAGCHAGKSRLFIYLAGLTCTPLAAMFPTRWWSAAVLRVQSKIVPRLLNGFSVTDGIWRPPREKCNLSVTFPFFATRNLDLASLKSIQVQLKRLKTDFTSILMAKANKITEWCIQW